MSDHDHCKNVTLSRKPNYLENQTKNFVFFYACLILSFPVSLGLCEISSQQTTTPIILNVILTIMCLISSIILITLMIYLFYNRYQTFEEAGKDGSKTSNIIFSRKGEKVGLYLRFGVILIGICSLIYVVLSNAKFKTYNNCLSPSDLCYGISEIIYFVVQAVFILKYHSIIILRHTKILRLGLFCVILSNITIWEMVSLTKIIESVNGSQYDPMECRYKKIDIASSYFLPAVSEYCVIAVAILYEIMKRLGKPALIETEPEDHDEHRIFRTIERAIPGVIIAVVIVIFGIISTVVIIVYDKIHDKNWVKYYHYSEEMLFYVTSLVICFLVFIKTRKLKFSFTFLSNNVDKNLLLLSCFLSIFFSAIIVVISFDYSHLDSLLIYRGLIALMEIVQIIAQTFVIQDAFYRCCIDTEKQRTKPGQNYIAILIGINFTLWVVKSFQLKNGDIVFDKYSEFYKKNSQNQLLTLFLYATLPLSILYRYHSSACLAGLFTKLYQDEIDRFENLLRTEGFNTCSNNDDFQNANTLPPPTIIPVQPESKSLPVIKRSQSLSFELNELEFIQPKKSDKYGQRRKTAKVMNRRDTLQHFETAQLRILSSQISQNLINKKLTATVSPIKDDEIKNSEQTNGETPNSFSIKRGKNYSEKYNNDNKSVKFQPSIYEE